MDSTDRPARTGRPASDAATAAADLLFSARHGRYSNPEPANTEALIAIGYALLALLEQGAQPVRRRWWQRGAR